MLILTQTQIKQSSCQIFTNTSAGFFRTTVIIFNKLVGVKGAFEVQYHYNIIKFISFAETKKVQSCKLLLHKLTKKGTETNKQ